MAKQSKKRRTNPTQPPLAFTFAQLADRADALTKCTMRALLITTIVGWTPDERADLVAQIQELDA
jgi:hypothetical protein